jgi:uncharacterized protein (DUF1015 family)
MAQVRPFRGILYDTKKIDIASVVAPPYDVISPSVRDDLYEKDKNNIVRVILGKEKKSDTARHNKYSRAGELFNEWLKKKIFVKDKKRAIYIYTQQYLHKGRKRTRTGFIALMRIEDPRKSGVLPHEYTLSKPREDRLNLIEKTQANLSPIFSLFQDKENKINGILKPFIRSEEPLFAIDLAGVTHKLWRMTDKGAINGIRRHMRNKRIFIADGHHRYEVALAHRNRMRKTRPFNENMNHVMMYFSSLSEKGGHITVLSTHRVVSNIEGFDESGIRLKLKKYFRVTNADSLEHVVGSVERAPRKMHMIGMYGGKRFYLLALKKGSCDHSSKKLDVTILHDLIISKILGVKNPESSIKYIRDEGVAVSLVDKGSYELAFFLRPTAVSDVKALAEKGEMMPQKSTYFYPKLLTGLVINKF